MKKNKSMLVSVLLVIIFAIVAIVSIVINIKDNSKQSIINNEYLWKIYDSNLEVIKNNMDEIAVDDNNIKWFSLKKVNCKDEDYVSQLNSLTADIRLFYQSYTGTSDYTVDVYKLLSPFKNENTITLKELEELKWSINREGVLKRFKNYDNLLISEDNTRRERFISEIHKITDYMKNTEFDDNTTFNDILIYKVYETQLVRDISNWLYQEYYSLK